MRYKVGDILVGNDQNEYGITSKGVKCEVVETHSSKTDVITVIVKDDPRYIKYRVLSKFFDLYKPKSNRNLPAWF